MGSELAMLTLLRGLHRSDRKELLLKALPSGSGLEHKVTQVFRGSKAIRGHGSSGVIQQWHCSRKICRRHWTLSFREKEKVAESYRKCVKVKERVFISCVCVRERERERTRGREPVSLGTVGLSLFAALRILNNM